MRLARDVVAELGDDASVAVLELHLRLAYVVGSAHMRHPCVDSEVVGKPLCRGGDRNSAGHVPVRCSCLFAKSSPLKPHEDVMLGMKVSWYDLPRWPSHGGQRGNFFASYCSLVEDIILVLLSFCDDEEPLLA